MRTYLLLAFVLCTAANGVLAQPVDVIGGPDGSTQTMHHCGYLPTMNAIYTSSPVTTRIVQDKLRGLGFYRAGIDGINGPATKQAVRAFQSDQNLAADGVVGPLTAQRLAFVSHGTPRVRSCWRPAQVGF